MTKKKTEVTKPEVANWISVGALADSFAPDNNSLARLDDLVGKRITLYTADGGTARYEFAVDGALDWNTSGPGGTESGSENCVVTRQQNSNTVTCACIPEKTKIDSKTGKTEIVCKKMREER